MSKWGAFHGRHAERMFTPVFNGFLEDLIANPEAPLFTRICAWVLRHSWGNHSDICVDSKGVVLTQTDCARDLGFVFKNAEGEMEVRRQKVNPDFLELKRMHYLRLDGQGIEPIDDPTEARFAFSLLPVDSPRTQSEENGKLPGFQSFIDEIVAREYPDEYRAYQEVERLRKEIRTGLMKRWTEFKERLSEGSSTNDAEASDGSGQPVGGQPDNASDGPGHSPPHPISLKPENKVNDSSSSFSLVRKAFESYAKTDNDLFKGFLKETRKATPDELVELINEKGPLVPKRAKNRAAYLATSVVNAVESEDFEERRKQPEPVPEVTLEEEIAMLEATLAQYEAGWPDYAGLPKMKSYLETLRSRLAERKPAESESGKPKAKRAGGHQ